MRFTRLSFPFSELRERRRSCTTCPHPQGLWNTLNQQRNLELWTRTLTISSHRRTCVAAVGRSSTRRSCSASTRRSVFNVDLTGDVLVFLFVFPREGVCSMSTSQVMYLYWSSLILCLVSPRSSNNGMFRCEFCGQGFIVAARLKHHRRNCQVLINKL